MQIESLTLFGGKAMISQSQAHLLGKSHVKIVVDWVTCEEL
jgi:hypothetical protein